MIEDEAQRIRQADRFNAFVAVRPEPYGAATGVIGGATIAIKDNIAVAGMPFTAGHPLFAQRIAETDAEVVRRLRWAGGRIVGVTQTDAGGFGVTTRAVINPLAPDLTAGGSSGGSAAAVAAGLASLGVGTDTGGSVRIPAACCGLYGFKPTWGRVPLDGVWPLARRFDHVGVLSADMDLMDRTVAALLPCRTQQEKDVGTVGLDFNRLARAAPNIRVAVLDLADVIQAAGLSVRAVTLPDLTETVATHAVLTLSAARSVYMALGSSQIDLLAPTARRSLALARELDEATVLKAEAAAAQAISKIERVFEEVDVILTPTLPIDPPLRNSRRVVFDGQDVSVVTALMAETCLANVTGCPAVVFPFGPNKPVPVSIQLMAARGDDARVLKFARELINLIDTCPRATTKVQCSRSFSRAQDCAVRASAPPRGWSPS